MKKNLLTVASTLLMAGLILFSACESEGPIGPQGPAGAQGQAGPQGTAGPKGEPGTANVIYSDWIPTSFTGSGDIYTGIIPAAAITQGVLDSADIRVYWREGGRVISLPYAQIIATVSYTVHQRFYVGRIDVIASYALSTQSFRYVIIPGEVKAGRKATVDFDDYNQVKDFFRLPE